jgi:hypothetical protein
LKNEPGRKTRNINFSVVLSQKRQQNLDVVHTVLARFAALYSLDGPERAVLFGWVFRQAGMVLPLLFNAMLTLVQLNSLLTVVVH